MVCHDDVWKRLWESLAPARALFKVRLLPKNNIVRQREVVRWYTNAQSFLTAQTCYELPSLMGDAYFNCRSRNTMRRERYSSFSFCSLKAWLPAAVLGVALAALWASGLDTAAFLAVNAWAQAFGERPWMSVTVLGDAAVLMTLFLPWVMRRPEVAWKLALAGLFVILATHGLKPLFLSLRPPAVLDPSVFRVIGPAHRLGSFPSGHTMAAFAYAGVMVLAVRSRWLGSVAVFAALGVGISRIAVGVHWPIDVAAGAALGWLSAALAVYVGERWRWGAHTPGVYWVGALAWLAALALLIAPHTGYEKADGLVRSLAGLVLLDAAWRGWRARRRRADGTV